MEKELLLTMKERARIEVVEHWMAEKIDLDEAARVLGRSPRTLYRMKAALLSRGLEGLIHGNRSRASPKRIPEKIRKAILGLATSTYADVNDTHFQELLADREGIRLGRETLRRLLREHGLAPKRKRKRPRYRSRRERKSSLGLMLQIDGSRHDWLEGRGPYLTLIGAIDDATNKRWALFAPSECIWAYMDLMHHIAKKDGLPHAVYSDKHTIFVSPREPTLVEQLKGIEPLTQFGRAMHELGVRIIPANSPQAKGRVERMWGSFQDRLVVELRLAKARNLKQANQVLQDFLVRYNQRFYVAPKDFNNLFRKAPAATGLDRILCLKESRIVNNDHTVSFGGLVLQIPPSKYFHSIAKKKVNVLQLRDGSILIEYRSSVVARFSKDAVSRLLAKHPNTPSQLRVA